jgi:O-antigen ligase
MKHGCFARCAVVVAAVVLLTASPPPAAGQEGPPPLWPSPGPGGSDQRPQAPRSGPEQPEEKSPDLVLLVLTTAGGVAAVLGGAIALRARRRRRAAPPMPEPGVRHAATSPCAVPDVATSPLAGAATAARMDTRRLALVLGAAAIGAWVPLAALPALSRRPDLAPLVFAAAAVGAVVLARPQWLVPAYVAFTWTAIGASHFGGFSPVETAGLALLAVAAVSALTRRALAAEALVVIALLGLPVLAASLLSAEQPGMPTDRLRDLSFIFLVALTVSGLTGVERTATLVTGAGIVLGLGAVYSVLVAPTVLFPLQAEDLGAPRAAGPFQESNFFALSLAALLPLALHVATRGGPWRPFGLTGVGFVIAGILATGSRGGLAAGFVGLVLYGVWAGPHRISWRALAATAAAVALLIPVFASQLESSTKRPVGGRATENRIAVAMFADHPFTGVGPGEYMQVYRDYSRRIGNDPRPVRASHSLVLEVAAEQGLVGLLGFAAMVLALITAARRRAAHRLAIGRAVICALAVYAVGSLFLHGSQLRIPYVLIGLLLALEVRAANPPPEAAT